LYFLKFGKELMLEILLSKYYIKSKFYSLLSTVINIPFGFVQKRLEVQATPRQFGRRPCHR